ncbi:MAG: hypothetical protein WAN05_19535, partial [Roseiarcus sp.]
SVITTRWRKSAQHHMQWRRALLSVLKVLTEICPSADFRFDPDGRISGALQGRSKGRSAFSQKRLRGERDRDWTFLSPSADRRAQGPRATGIRVDDN